MNEKKCFGCKYSGMDMDMAPYCAHPKTLVTMPYGSSLSQQDPARDHCGPNKDSWEPREDAVKKRFVVVTVDETGEVLHKHDVTGWSEKRVERRIQTFLNRLDPGAVTVSEKFEAS